MPDGTSAARDEYPGDAHTMPEDGRRPLYWAMSVADDLRAESRAAGRLIGPPESIELAFRLGDEDVAMFCAARGCSPAEARAAFRRARGASRRASVANETARP